MSEPIRVDIKARMMTNMMSTIRGMRASMRRIHTLATENNLGALHAIEQEASRWTTNDEGANDDA